MKNKVSSRLAYLSFFAIVSFLFLCTEPTSPYEEHDNVKLSVSTECENCDSVRVGDSIAIVAALFLPNLVSEVHFFCPDEFDTSITADGSGEHDTLRLRHAFAATGRKTIIVKAIKTNDDELEKTISDLHIKGIPPIIALVGKTERNLTESSSDTIHTQVTGTGPFQYAWFRNDQAIPQATNSFIVVTGTNAFAGEYYCIVTNSEWGADTSATIMVEVVGQKPSVSILAGSQISIREGESDTIRAEATGTLPITFHWLHQGSPIPGAEGYSLIISGTHEAAGEYRCVASHAEWGSDTSKPITVSIISAEAPPAPTDLRIAESTGELVKTTWNPVENAESYKVYRAQTLDGTQSLLGKPTAAEFTDTDPLMGNSYYWVTTVKGEYESERSQYAMNEGAPVEPPTAPKNLVVLKSTESFNEISWDGVQDAESYGIYRATTPDGTPLQIEKIQSTRYIDPTAGAYYYWVTAFRYGLESEKSNSAFSGSVTKANVRFVFDTLSLEMQQGENKIIDLTDSISNPDNVETSISLKESVAGISVDAAGLLTLDAATVSVGSHTATLILAGEEEDDRDTTTLLVTVAGIEPSVSLVDADGLLSLLEEDLCTLSVTAGGTEPISFAWYKGDAPIDQAISNTLILGPVALADSGVYFCVATNEVGSDSSSTVRVVVRSKEAPPAPDGLSFSTSDPYVVSLTWNAVSEAENYKVYRSADQSWDSPELIGTTGEASYTDSADAWYYYAVASLTHGFESLSNSIYAGPLNTAPNWDADTISVETTTGDSITIKMAERSSDPQEDALTYQVHQLSFGTKRSGNKYFFKAPSSPNTYYDLLIVSDGEFSDTAVVKITVLQGNRAPRFTKSSVQYSTSEGKTLTVNLANSCSDPDGDVVTYKATESDSRLTVTASGEMTVEAGVGDAGTVVFGVEATDGSLSDTMNVIVTIDETWCTITFSAQHGTITPSPTAQNNRYRLGDEIQVTAEAANGYKFDKWTNGLSGSSNPKTAKITGDMTISAKFVSFGVTECQNVSPNSSLNSKIRSVSAQGQGTICPEPGKYENGTVEVQGKIQIRIR